MNELVAHPWGPSQGIEIPIPVGTRGSRVRNEVSLAPRIRRNTRPHVRASGSSYPREPSQGIEIPIPG